MVPNTMGLHDAIAAMVKAKKALDDDKLEALYEAVLEGPARFVAA